MIYQSNDITFVRTTDYKFGVACPVTLTSGTFTISDFKISANQDEEGKIQIGKVFACERDGKFNFSIGRHGTKEVAEWFSQAVSDGQGNGGNTFRTTPDKLNFALKGDLSLVFEGLNRGPITASFKDVVLAQGHTGASNNWWLGSKSLQCGATLGSGHSGWISGKTLRIDEKYDWVKMLCKRGGENPVSEITIMAVMFNPGF